MTSDEPRRFRLSFGWVLGHHLFVMAVVFWLMVAVGYAGGGRPLTRLLLSLSVVMSALAVGLSVGTTAAVWCLFVQPRSDGLVFGRAVLWPLVVPWKDIIDVRPLGLLLIPNLLLTVRNRGRLIVLPLRLDDLRGFAEAVAEYAGEDHPLTEALWERLAVGGRSR